MDDGSLIRQVLAVILDEGELQLCPLTVCYRVSRGWRDELLTRGFSQRVAVLCVQLGKGGASAIDLSKKASAMMSSALPRLGWLDQVRRFLERNQQMSRGGGAEMWLGAAMKEPSGGILQSAAASMNGWAWRANIDLAVPMPKGKGYHRGIGSWAGGRSDIMVLCAAAGGARRQAKGEGYGPLWLAGGCSDGSIRVWRIVGLCGELELVSKLEDGHSELPVGSVSFEPAHASELSGGGHQGLKLPPAHQRELRAPRLVSGGADGRICVWDDIQGGGSHSTCLGASDEWMTCVAWGKEKGSHEGCIAAGGLDGVVRLFAYSGPLASLVTPGPSQEIRAHRPSVRSVAWGGSGLLASSGDDGSVRVWDTATASLMHELVVKRGVRVTCVACQHTQQDHGEMLVAGGALDGSVRMWRLPVGTGNGVDGTRPSEDNDGGTPRGAAGGTRGGAQLVSTVKARGGGVLCVAFLGGTEGGGLVTGSADSCVRLWGGDREATRVLEGHSDHVRGVCCWPEADLIASGSEDGTVRVWDVHRWERDEDEKEES